MGRHPGELISQLSTQLTQNIMPKDVLESRIYTPFFRKDAQNDVVVTLVLACIRSTPKSWSSMQKAAQELANHLYKRRCMIFRFSKC